MPDRFETFNEEARWALVHAQQEAEGFRHNYVGTEHLLFGIVREGEGVAAGVLESLNVVLYALRGEVMRTVASKNAPTGTAGTRGWRSLQTSNVPFIDETPSPGAGRSENQLALHDLLIVIAIGETRVNENTPITLLSLEAYADGFVLNLRILRARPERGFEHPKVECSVRDDRGGKYEARPFGGIGTENQWRLTERFMPALDASAKVLQFEVTAVHWIRRGDSKSSHRQTGPWTFTIPLTGER